MNESLPSEPTEVDLNDPLFNAIWQVIKPWDLSRDGPPHLYAGASGTDVMTILSAVRAALSAPPAEAVRQPLTEAQIEHLWDTRVGYPTATRPLGIRDVLLFARAIELAHGIRVVEAGVTGAQE